MIAAQQPNVSQVVDVRNRGSPRRNAHVQLVLRKSRVAVAGVVNVHQGRVGRPDDLDAVRVVPEIDPFALMPQELVNQVHVFQAPAPYGGVEPSRVDEVVLIHAQQPVPVRPPEAGPFTEAEVVSARLYVVIQGLRQRRRKVFDRELSRALPLGLHPRKGGAELAEQDGIKHALPHLRVPAALFQKVSGEKDVDVAKEQQRVFAEVRRAKLEPRSPGELGFDFYQFEIVVRVRYFVLVNQSSRFIGL